ncbi:hypothetical protein Nepgr_016718 [Nepenthes gracilis]|uniref:Netrin receptor DCC n=1 Tax=Nepenthes gracilis TaxID=150966 RepID=A0AAD3XRJ7_NEPGR|nr:hypothetical protein Nepgr_016718 [Nepenthes gracilis]
MKLKDWLGVGPVGFSQSTGWTSRFPLPTCIYTSQTMPTFTAVALDRLLEPGASESVSNKSSALESNLERRNTAALKADGAKSVPKRPSVPLRPMLEGRNSSPLTAMKKAQWPQISPVLYTTPESRPLPDSPTLFSPSPYLINHKRRGPRLMKSFTEQNVLPQQKDKEVEEISGNECTGDTKVDINCSGGAVSAANAVEEERVNGFHGGRTENGETGNGVIEENGGPQVAVRWSSERDGEIEDFFDPRDSMSFTSNTDAEDDSSELSAKMGIPVGEFFDAWEELSSDSGEQRQPSMYDLEAELRGIRLSWLMEIEKRKQAEEALNSLQSQWQILTQKLRDVGLVPPADPTNLSEDGQLDIDPVEEICRQVYLTRIVSESIGREAAKAEAQAQMEAQLESKNFEIARLCDKLNYYDAMNREMSQRNQEAIEVARRDRQKQKRLQRWVWGSIAAAIALGTASLAWSHITSESGSSSTGHLQAFKPDVAADG